MFCERLKMISICRLCQEWKHLNLRFGWGELGAFLRSMYCSHLIPSPKHVCPWKTRDQAWDKIPSIGKYLRIMCSTTGIFFRGKFLSLPLEDLPIPPMPCVRQEFVRAANRGAFFRLTARHKFCDSFSQIPKNNWVELIKLNKVGSYVEWECISIDSIAQIFSEGCFRTSSQKTPGQNIF